MRGKIRLAKTQDQPSEDRLKAFEERLEKAKAGAESVSHMKKDYAQANLAWRMVIELVAGLGIGFGMGYGLDYVLGTMPLFLVIFLFLGLAAGVKTMLASAQEIQTQALAKAGADDPAAQAAPDRAAHAAPDRAAQAAEDTAAQAAEDTAAQAANDEEAKRGD